MECYYQYMHEACKPFVSKSTIRRVRHFKPVTSFGSTFGVGPGIWISFFRWKLLFFKCSDVEAQGCVRILQLHSSPWIPVNHVLAVGSVFDALSTLNQLFSGWLPFFFISQVIVLPPHGGFGWHSPFDLSLP